MAEAAGGGLRELLAQRVFTRIGRSLANTGTIPAAKVAEVAAVVAGQAGLARDLGARPIEVVATAAIRGCDNPGELAAAVHAATGLTMRVLTGREEARLAFAGATRTLGSPPEGRVTVVDVGGGSTEIAVGSVAGGVSWSESFPVGSGVLADAHLHSDPPAPRELEAMRAQARQALAGLRPPASETAVAVGGSATSLRTLVGPSLDPGALERALRLLASTPAAEVAADHGLDPERVRLLPAGIAVLEQVARHLEVPLAICRGGLREGILLELAARAGPGPSAGLSPDV